MAVNGSYSVKLLEMDVNGLTRASKSCDHATARSHKSFQRLRKIWVFERKNAQFTTVSPFLGQFSIFMLVFGPFSLRKTFERKYWSRKKSLLLEGLPVTWHFFCVFLLKGWS